MNIGRPVVLPRALLAQLLLLLSGLAFFTPIHAVTTVSLIKSLSTSGPVESGQTFNYNLAWSCPGSVSPADDCMDMNIVEPLPATLQATALPSGDGKLAKVCVQDPGDPLPNYATCSQPSVSTGSPTETGAILHFIFIPQVTAGDSGSLSLQTRFPGGDSPDGATASNSATINASCNAVAVPGCTNPNPITSNSDPVTVNATDEVSITKTIQQDAAIGYNMVYRIRVCPGSGTGYLNPTNAVVTDTLPAEATFVSANPAATSQLGQELTWDLASPLTACQNIDVTVNYGSGSNAPDDVRNNTVSLTYDPMTGTPTLPRTDSVIHTLEVPNPSLNRSKTASDSTVNPGQQLTYTLTASNNGNIPLGVSISDTVPGMCQVASFDVAADATACAVTLSDNSPAVCVPGSNSAASVGADNTTLFVKSISVEYGNAGNTIVAIGDDRSVSILCDVINPGWDGTNYAMPATVDNSATFNAANNLDSIGPFVVTRSVTLREASANPTIQPDASKVQSPGGVITPGNDVTFNIGMTNSASYSSAPEQVAIVGPVFADLLLPGMTFVGSSEVSSPAGCTMAPTIRTLDDYNGTGRTLVVWDWSGSGCTLNRGDTVTYNLVATVGDTTLGGTQTNNVAFLGSDNTPDVARGTEGCATSGGFLASLLTGTLDATTGVSDSTRVCHAANANFTIQRITNITSNKAVTATLEPPATWLLNTAEPNNVARSIREGNVRWQLRINNTANVPLDNIELIDIVPAAAQDNPPGTDGNTGVGTGSTLGSTWTPIFVRDIDLSAAPVGTKAYYTQAPNPCRNNIVTATGCNPMTALADGVALMDETDVPAPGDAGQWSTVLPSDPERVRAFRIVYPTAHQIMPGESLAFEFPMFIKADAPLSDCTAAANSSCSNIAWNTFGFSYRESDSGVNNQSAPTRVGVIVQDFPAGSAALGNFVWHDTDQNGIQDAGEANNGINNVLVELWRDPDGTQDNGDEIKLTEARTASHPDTALPGYYHFPVLPPTVGPERYFVRFYPPAGMTGSPANQGGDDAVDSDGAATVVGSDTLFQTAGVSLSPSQDRLDVDQGFYDTTPTFSLGNRVWLDPDNNGIDDDGAGNLPGSGTGIAGVRVELWAVDAAGTPIGGAPLQTQDTQATGHYLFTELAAGNYRVVIPASEFTAGQALNGLWSSGTVRANGNTVTETAPVAGNSDLDSRDHGLLSTNPLGPVAAGSVWSGLVTLGPLATEPTNEIGTLGPRQTDGYYDLTPDNRTNLSIDFGFHSYSVGNLLWFDADNNGSRDGGEPPVVDATVELLDAWDVVVGSSTSDADGHWRVDGLPAGTYRARVVASEFQAGGALVGYFGSTGTSTDFTLSGDNQDHGLDAGTPSVNGIISAPFILGASLPQGETVTGSTNGGHAAAGDASDSLVVDFGFNLNSAPLAPFDPPYGKKVVNSGGIPELEWTMVWINPNVNASVPLQVIDPVPVGSTYVAASLTCEARGSSSQTLCTYDAINNRVVFEGVIGPDGPAATDETTASNEVVIRFRVQVNAGVHAVNNQATANWDPDGDGTLDGPPISTDNPDTGAPGDPTGWAQPVSIPTLSEWGMILLTLFAAMLAWPALRRR